MESNLKYFISLSLPGGIIGRFDDIESARSVAKVFFPDAELSTAGGVVIDTASKATFGICGYSGHEPVPFRMEHGIAGYVELTNLKTGQKYECIQSASEPGFVVGVGRFGKNLAYEIPQSARERVADRFKAVFSKPLLERGPWIAANKSEEFTV